MSLPRYKDSASRDEANDSLTTSGTTSEPVSIAHCNVTTPVVLPTQIDDPSLTLLSACLISDMNGRFNAAGITQVAHLYTDDHCRNSPNGGARLRISVLDLITQIIPSTSESKVGKGLANVLAACGTDTKSACQLAETNVLFIFLDSVDILCEDSRRCDDILEFNNFHLSCRNDTKDGWVYYRGNSDLR